MSAIMYMYLFSNQFHLSEKVIGRTILDHFKYSELLLILLPSEEMQYRKRSQL